ncbi:MAG: FxsA family protein [Sulfurimonas sp.]
MLILIAIPFLLLELYFSLSVGETIGFIWSAVWIVMTVIIGVQLLRLSPFAVMGNLDAVTRGKLSLEDFHSASSAYFIGSILLIIPGVLSDFLGVAALLYTLYLQFIAKITPEKDINMKKKREGEDDVIDVEVIDEHTDRNPQP